jgi:hypothetical protein
MAEQESIRRVKYNLGVAKPAYAIGDLGAERVVAGAEYRTYYSKCVGRKLIDRKGPWRTRLHFTFTESLGRHVLDRPFRCLDRRGARAPSCWRSAPSAS